MLIELGGLRIERDGRLVGAEVAGPVARRALAEGKVVIVRGLLPAPWAAAIRENACRAMERDPSSPIPSDAAALGTSPNLTRMEVVAAQEGASARAFRTRLYFPWNDCPSDEVPAALALARLRNVLAERDETLGADGASTFTVAQVVHYPRGGGFLARHFDHDDGLYCVIIVALSAPGRDFERGGLFVEPGGQRVDIDALLSPGDACLFRPDLYHGVDPIDSADSGVDFADPRGRWVLNPMFRSAAAQPEAARERPPASPTQALSADAAPSRRLAPSADAERPSKLALSPDEGPAPSTAAEPMASAESLLFREWCLLLGLVAPGRRLGNVEVAALDEEAVSFLLPGSSSGPLRVSCRPPGTGPTFRATRRYGVYYLADGRESLSPVEERFLHLLCELTHRRETARPDAAAGRRT